METNAQTEGREKDSKSKYRRQWEAEKLKGWCSCCKDPDLSNRIGATCYDLDRKTMQMRQLGDKPILINSGKTLESPDLIDFY